MSIQHVNAIGNRLSLRCHEAIWEYYHDLFCSVEPDLIILQNNLAFAMFDGFPVSQGHSLIIPRRHVADYSDLTANEILAIHQILAEVRSLIQKRFSPDGFNVGVNIDFTAGQTIMHVHVHLIPRYKGDVSDPVGGVRNVIPGKGNYLCKAFAVKS